MSRKPTPLPTDPLIKRLYLMIESKQLTKGAAYILLQHAGCLSSYSTILHWLQGISVPSRLAAMDLKNALDHIS